MNLKTTTNENTIGFNIAEAHLAMSSLLPQLPAPRLAEWMTAREITLPNSEVLHSPNTLPILESPTALLAGLGPYSVAGLPKHWIPAHKAHKEQWTRTVQLLRLHCCCQRIETAAGDIPDLSHCDGVVAGLLLLLIRPCPGKFRRRLVQAACNHPFGAFLAAHGMLIEDEHLSVIASVARNTRLASALVRRDGTAAEMLPSALLNNDDIWAATLALNDRNAEAWLPKTLKHAGTQPIAAVTAVVLQPNANESQQQRWITVIKQGQPRFSYEAVRWCKHTWPPLRWLKLRDQLKPGATSDLGQFHCLWYRDIEPEKADEALLNDSFEILWAAELADAVRNSGHGLRRRCLLRLKSNPADTASTLTLRWLNQRRGQA